MSDVNRPVGLSVVYGVAAVLVIVPMIEFFAQVWPIRIGIIGWRFGAVGFAVERGLLPMVGLALVTGVAMFTHRRVTLRAISVFSWVSATTLAIVLVLFTLDALQLRVTVRPGVPRQGFELAAGKVLVMGALYAPLLIWLGVAAWRAAGIFEPQHAPKSRAGAGFLITQRREPAK